MSKNNISIIGSGLVGSLLALYLAKRKHQVAVYEQRPDMRSSALYGGRSINLALSTRGWTALDKVGVGDEIRKIATPMYGRQIHNADGSQVYQPYGKEGEAIYSVSRGELNKVLMTEAEKHEEVSFRFNQKLVKLDMKRNHLLMNDTEQDETYEVSSDVIFGADGAYSRVRYGMQKMPRFNYSQDHLPHVYKELTIPAGPNGEYLIEKNALHIWPRGHFMMIALPNFDGSFTCTLFVPHEGADHIHDIKTPEQVSEYMQKHFADAVALMPNMIEDFLSNPISNLVTVRCFPWINGKTALIGDASHAIVPFYGQGMNSGFEDVRVLDDLLESGESDWSKILDTYQNLRKPNGDAIAELALNNFIEMRDLVADPQFIFRKKIEKYLHEKMGDEFTPLYNLVSFSNIPYKTALDTGYMQNRLFADLFKEKDLESKWDSEFTVQFVKNWMQQNNL